MISRRHLLLSTSFFAVKGAFAEELAKTASVEEGPFYPHKLPLDTDNDLLVVNNSITPAVGEIAHLSGRLLDAKGDPIRNATIEIWEVDNNGVYLRQHDEQGTAMDKNFQGYGRFLTGSTGEYYFRALKPVIYPGRQAPHIHFKVGMKGRRDWTTQLYIQGHPGNMRDGVYRRLREAEKATVTREFTAIAGSKVGASAAKFDIVMGYTPEL